jgi:deoxyadenosine/deoxycytidine kinase
LERILFKQSTLKLEELNKQCEPDSIEMNPLLEYFYDNFKNFSIFSYIKLLEKTQNQQKKEITDYWQAC